MSGAHEDHVRRIRAAVDLLNEAVAAAECDGFSTTLRVNRTRSRVTDFAVNQRVTTLPAPSKKLAGRRSA